MSQAYVEFLYTRYTLGTLVMLQFKISREGSKMADLQEYKCPSCGGALAFDVGIQMLKCPFCESTYDAGQMNKANDAAPEDKPQEAVWTQSAAWTQEERSSLLVYTCKSCAGEIIADANTGATSCPYCKNPVVMTGQFSGSMRPDSIVPFKLDKQKAINALKSHYIKRPFLPSLFQSQNTLNEIKGIYIPFWLYSAEAHADIDYTGKKLRRWSDSNYDYTETKNYRVVRKGSVQYRDVPVDASTKMPDDLMNSLEPYHMDQAKSFNTAYMAGYLADKFDVDQSSCVQRAKNRMKRSTERSFAETVTGYDSIDKGVNYTKFSNISTKYTLLPVWYLVTSWNNKTYTFAMNGQTGKFVGELPIDKMKVRLAAIGVTLFLFGIITCLYLVARGALL